MSLWLIDPELFLYAKGIGPDDVHLWRCKKPESSSSSSSLVVPMKSDDFDYVSKVENHKELIGDMFDRVLQWDESDYKRLVKYIYEKHLLVNSQGFVIAEVLHKADKDGNKKTDDVNEEEEEKEDVPGIYYIRSLDVLPLKPFIPNLRERPIPLRTVKYLGDLNGKAAMMEEKNSDLTNKLTARVDDLESKNKTLDTNVTKLTAGQVAMTDTINDLKSKNKTMEGKVTKLTADLVTQMYELAILQKEVKNNPNADNDKEVWMNDITISSELVGVGALQSWGTYGPLIVLKPMGTYTVDDRSTNVRARYWHRIMTNGSGFTAIFLETLIPNKENARFSDKWRSVNIGGKTYVITSLLAA